MSGGNGGYREVENGGPESALLLKVTPVQSDNLCLFEDSAVDQNHASLLEISECWSDFLFLAAANLDSIVKQSL